MKAKFTIAAFCLCIIYQRLHAQLPLVYNVENTGASCARPVLPSFDQLPVIQPLTDPFMWSDNKGRSTSFSDWECRRNEIKAEIENYEIGTKPPRPDTITASYAAGTLTVNVTRNGQTLTLTSQVSLPSGSGPFPAIIGMNSPSGSVPANIFTSRNIARITFNHNQVTTYGNPQLSNPYFRLYPEQNLANSGQYSGWAWGVSRLIDGLELVQSSLPIDLKHIGVTGCSYAGKMALFAGAYDERIALTIAQESGGGGAPAWRVSETIGAVENLGATDYNWFKDDMRQFSNVNVPKLPHDHHELMAMVAPRALLVTGNTDYEWLANPSAYVSARAAHEVWKTFGIGDRFGFYIDGGHPHCAVPATQVPAMEAFVQKFLVGDTTVNTNITTNPYPQMDYQKWYQWWGSGIPVLPVEPPGIQKFLEAECAAVGSHWNILTDTAASNGTYVVVKNGFNSTAAAPPGAASAVVFSFTIDSAAGYNFLGRLNCPTADDDSYWIKVDSGAFVSANGLGTTGWGWVRLTNAPLTVGTHTLTIAYREDGAKLDKVLVTTSNAIFSGKGPVGTNCGQPPVIAPAQAFSVRENAANNFLVGKVRATDADSNSVLRNWKIVDSTGTRVFAINDSTGQLSVKNRNFLDFDSVASYTLSVTVSDGIYTSEAQTLKINLVNENDNKPVVAAVQNLLISEAAVENDTTGKVRVNDLDDNNEPGFTTLKDWEIVGGNGADLFRINAGTGQLRLKKDVLLDFENKTSYNLRVRVSDGKYTSDVATVVIKVKNENDNTPVVKRNQSFTVSETAAKNSMVAAVLANDDDDKNDSLFTKFQKWEITGGTGSAIFSISESTGTIMVKNNALMDFESQKTSYTLAVKVSDGKYTSPTVNVTLNLSNANDNVPIVRAAQTFNLYRLAGDNTVAGTVLARDDDDNNQPGFTLFQNWQITGGNGAGIFTINASTGQLLLASSTALILDNKKTYRLKVKVGDGVFTSAAEDLTIVITAVTTLHSQLSAVFKSFDAKRTGANSVVLNFVTTAERENKGFYVQRSMSGVWKTIGFVPAGNTDGLSDSENAYTYADANASSDLVQYRIVQVDAAGREKQSNIRLVKGIEAATNVTVYPNPSVTGVVNVVFGNGEAKEVRISDLSGKILKTYHNARSNLKVSGLRSGVYYIRITDPKGGEMTTRMIVVQ